MGGGHDINPSTTTSTMNSGGGNTGEALHAFISLVNDERR